MINLILTDDHTIVLDGLKALLTGQDDLNILGEAHSGRELLALLTMQVPDVILMDIALPDCSGIGLSAKVRQEYPSVKILFLSMYTDEEYVFNAIKAGASGYLPKNISQNELLMAIRTIYAGSDYFSESISNIILKSYIKKSRDKEPDTLKSGDVLSKREMEILKLFAEGCSNADISNKLFISIRTVESHKNHIMQKLNLKSTVDLIRFAIKNHIVEI